MKRNLPLFFSSEYNKNQTLLKFSLKNSHV